MDQDKLEFVQQKFVKLVKTLPADTKGKWGKMNLQQMIEHVCGFFKVSTRQLHYKLVTPEELLPKAKAFLLSDKVFRENTKAPVLPEDPLPLQFATLIEAIDDLEQQVHFFVQEFSSGAIRSSLHPVFGELNFDEWVLLHYKHVTHHARQFNLEC